MQGERGRTCKGNSPLPLRNSKLIMGLCKRKEVQIPRNKSLLPPKLQVSLDSVKKKKGQSVALEVDQLRYLVNFFLQNLFTFNLREHMFIKALKCSKYSLMKNIRTKSQYLHFLMFQMKMNAMILEVRATSTQIASTQMVLSSVSANQDLWAMDCVAKEVGLRLKYP